MWEVETGREIRRFHRHTGVVTAVAFSPDESQILMASGEANADLTARTWDIRSGHKIRRFAGIPFPVIYRITPAFDPQFFDRLAEGAIGDAGKGPQFHDNPGAQNVYQEQPERDVLAPE